MLSNPVILFSNKLKELSNLIALAGIQGTNAIIPVALFPYLVSVLGAPLFARLAVLEVISLYVLTISLYSFETFGVQKILQCKNNRSDEIGKIFLQILFLRLLLFSFSASIVIIIFAVFFPEDLIYLVIWMLLPLGQIIQCSYFYQAIGRNQKNALIIVPSRIIFVLGGYLLIKGPEDLIAAHLIIPLSYLFSGVVSLFVCLQIIGKERYAVNYREAWKFLRQGWLLFVGNLAVALYRNTNILLLTAVTENAVAVSAYAIAEKMVKMLQAIFGPMNQVTFPRLISRIHPDEKAPLLTIFKYTKPQIIWALVIIILVDILAYADSINGELLFNKRTLNLFLIMSIAPLFGICNFMFGVVGLSALNKSGSFARGTFLAGVSSVIICFIGSRLFLGFGAALAFLLAEVILFWYVIFSIIHAQEDVL